MADMAAPPSYEESMIEQQEKEKKLVSFGPIKLDIEFAKSVFGILWALEMVLSLIAYICVESSGTFVCVYLYGATYSFFLFTSLSSFISALTWYIFFLLAINSKIKCIPWWPSIIFWSCLFGLFYLIGSILLAAHSCGLAGFAAGAFFGFACLVVFVIEGWLAIKEFRLRREAAKEVPNAENRAPIIVF
ncbi:hypothetical protein ScPMuIL_001053 [Solemya velum]